MIRAVPWDGLCGLFCFFTLHVGDDLRRRRLKTRAGPADCAQFSHRTVAMKIVVSWWHTKSQLAHSNSEATYLKGSGIALVQILT